MQIELSDHVGVSPDRKPVDHDQWVVFCDGTQVGYLQKTEGAWLSCIVWMDDATKAELVQAVSEAAAIHIGGAAIPVDPALLKDEGEEE